MHQVQLSNELQGHHRRTAPKGMYDRPPGVPTQLRRRTAEQRAGHGALQRILYPNNFGVRSLQQDLQR